MLLCGQADFKVKGENQSLLTKIDDKRFPKINLINLSFYQIERRNMIFIIPRRAIGSSHSVSDDVILTIS